MRPIGAARKQRDTGSGRRGTPRRVAVWGLLASGLLVACVGTPGAPGGGGGATPGAPGAPTPGVTQTPNSKVLRLDFENAPLGKLPQDWVSVSAEMRAQGKTPPSWLYDGTWEVAAINRGSFQSKALRQTEKQPEPWVSLIRYRGTHFGPDGQLPKRYRFEVSQQPIASPYNLPPTGDQGVPLYYLDATHYLEVVNTPRELQVWYSDGAQPMNGRGWKRLFNRSMSTNPGDVRRVGGIVDVTNKTFVLLVDGKPEATLQVPDLDASKPHGMALRAIGNEVNFDDLEVTSLD